MVDKVTAADVKAARVTIELGAEEVVLIPSPAAMLALSSKYDGFSPLIASLQRLNLQAAIDVVVSGSGVDVPSKAAKAIADKVPTAGIVGLMPSLVEFTMILANGGKPLKEEAAGQGEGDPPKI